MNIIRAAHCKECGGGIGVNACCSCCGMKSDDYEKSFLSIKPYMDFADFYMEKIYPMLLKNEILDEHSETIFKFLLKNDMIEDEMLPDANIIIAILKNKKIIRYETYEELMKRSIEKAMRGFNISKAESYNPSCFITSFDDIRGGALEDIYVTIDKDVCSNFYENGDILSLVTVYHELRHIFQNICAKTGSFEENLFLMIKENLIRKHELKKYGTDNYYKMNYDNTSYELDARKFGVQWLINLLNMFNLSMASESLEVLKTKYVCEEDSNQRKVIINGKEEYKTVDELFDEVIKEHPEYLSLYPQLQVEYIIDNGIVRKKARKELIYTLLECNDINIKEYIKNILKKQNPVKYNNKNLF